MICMQCRKVVIIVPAYVLTLTVVGTVLVKWPTRCRKISTQFHDDVIKWKYFPRYWPFVRGIYRSPVNSSHKGQWCGALMLSLICAWTDSWENNGDVGDIRRHHAHYDVIVIRVFWMVIGLIRKSKDCVYGKWNHKVPKSTLELFERCK